MLNLQQAASAASKIPVSQVGKIASLSKFRYGHDPSHYPIKALRYVATHRELWALVFKVASIGILISFLCLVLLLALALKPQALAFGGAVWWSWMLAVFAVLLETAIAASVLMLIAQSKCQTELFVLTMKLEGKWREDEMKKQSFLKDFQILKKNFFVRVLTYPLCLVPFLGSALYSAINATFIGWDYMDRYFDAVHLSGMLQRKEVLGEDRSDCSALFHRSTYNEDNEYARFGFVVAFLEAIPVVGSVLFPLTNACAAALFACDIEEAGGVSVLPLAKAREKTGGEAAYGSTEKK